MGLEKAGFETIACIDADKDARETINLNRREWNLLETKDVNQLVAEITPESLGLRLGELDVLAGGPPCQPFSKAAQWAETGRAGMGDPRSTCIGAFLRLADIFLPKVILVENVPGFVTGRTSALSTMTEALAAINSQHQTRYELQWLSIDAADIGVPQHRQRAIMVALKDGSKFTWPTATHEVRRVRAWDALRDLDEPELPKASGKWAGLLASIPEGSNYQHHTELGDGEPLFGYRTRFWSFLLKLAKDEPAWTIPAKPGPATGPFHWDNRPLTIKERLRLQSFPANWRLAGSLHAQIRLVGNATPPLLGEVIGRALGRQVFKLKYSGPPKLAIARSRAVPARVAPRSVPSKFLARKGRHAAHPGPGKGPKPIRKNPAPGALATLEG